MNIKMFLIIVIIFLVGITLGEGVYDDNKRYVHAYSIFCFCEYSYIYDLK